MLNKRQASFLFLLFIGNVLVFGAAALLIQSTNSAEIASLPTQAQLPSSAEQSDVQAEELQVAEATGSAQQAESAQEFEDAAPEIADSSIMVPEAQLPLQTSPLTAPGGIAVPNPSTQPQQPASSNPPALPPGQFNVLQPTLPPDTGSEPAVLEPIDDTPGTEVLVGDDPTVIRSRLVSIDFDALAQASAASTSFVLNLFDDTSFTVQQDTVSTSPSGSVQYNGVIRGFGVIGQPDFGQVMLTYREGILFGTVITAVGVYSIEYVEPGVHRVLQLDQSAFPPDIVIDENASVQDTAGTTASTNNVSSASTGIQIDLLVLYTDDVRAAVGGATAAEVFAESAVQVSNQTLANSDISSFHFRLVHSQEVAYDESGDAEEDRGCLRSTSDDCLDQAHTIRDNVGADIVLLMVEELDACGIAYIIENGDDTRAFSIVARTCATGNLSFPHEIGHIMGARHDRYQVDKNEGGADSAADKYGYVYLPGLWRTVMAYNTECEDQVPSTNCMRIPYFSNPLVDFPPLPDTGTPTGIALGPGVTDAANVSRVIASNALTVSNFRGTVNQSPEIVVPPSVSGNEGTTLSVPITITDADGDSIVAVTASLGSIAFSGGTTWTWSYTPPDGPATATVTITADDGENYPPAEMSFDVTVANVAPTATFASAAGIVAPGEPVALQFSSQFDPGTVDTATGFLYSFDCNNDGVFERVNSTSATYNCTYASSGNYVAAGIIADKDGGSTLYTVSLIVNAPPEIANPGSQSVNEGSTITLPITITDLEGDPLTVNASRGTISYATGDVWEWEFASTDGPAESGPVTIFADDGFARPPAEQTFDLTVINVPPIATFENLTGLGTFGQPLTLGFSNQFDPSPVDTAAGFLYSYDCEGDGIFEVVDGTEATYDCSYAAPGYYTAQGRIADKDGGFTDYYVDVVIAIVVTSCEAQEFVNAVVLANTFPGAPIPMELNGSCTYEFTQPHNFVMGPNGLPVIDTSVILNINGNGAIIRRAAGQLRFFYVSPGAELLLTSMTVQEGDPGGDHSVGAIYNDGTLSLVTMTLTNNRARYVGAVYSTGAVIIQDSTISNNSAAEHTGAIRIESGTLEITNGVFSGNRSRWGGAIYNVGGVVSALGSTFNDNYTDEHGAIIANESGDILLVQSSFASNRTRFGSIVYNDTGSVTLTGSQLTDSYVVERGVGIHNEAGIVQIDNARFDNNQTRFGSAVYNVAGDTTITMSTFINSSVLEEGGALYNAGTMRVFTSTFANNSARFGGSIYNEGTLVLQDSLLATGSVLEEGGAFYNASGSVVLANSTISSNEARFGAGIFVEGGEVLLTNVTIALNQSTERGGGILVEGGSVTANNTLIATNAANQGPDVWGNFTAESMNNLLGIGDGSNLVDGINGHVVGSQAAPVDPLLGPLQSNGGITQTHALLTGSSAIDAGNSALALDADGISLPYDQRGVGFSRILGASVDTGAFETTESAIVAPIPSEVTAETPETPETAETPEAPPATEAPELTTEPETTEAVEEPAQPLPPATQTPEITEEPNTSGTSEAPEEQETPTETQAPEPEPPEGENTPGDDGEAPEEPPVSPEATAEIQ